MDSRSSSSFFWTNNPKRNPKPEADKRRRRRSGEVDDGDYMADQDTETEGILAQKRRKGQQSDSNQSSSSSASSKKNLPAESNRRRVSKDRLVHEKTYRGLEGILEHEDEDVTDGDRAQGRSGGTRRERSPRRVSGRMKGEEMKNDESGHPGGRHHHRDRTSQDKISPNRRHQQGYVAGDSSSGTPTASAHAFRHRAHYDCDIPGGRKREAERNKQ